MFLVSLEFLDKQGGAYGDREIDEQFAWTPGKSGTGSGQHKHKQYSD
ncbi:MAG: hypothetical protein N838_33385 [Thiohalocapsa sp. PB-PSB1]|nr:MAG: hypothetical protein N838_33385 [Thiohalocapsa sp. PB-PSB1]